MVPMFAHVEPTRLNEWWPAAIIGLLATLFLGPADGNAQVRHRGLPLPSPDAQRVADNMASNDQAWSEDFRNYVQRAPDRRGMVDRAKGVLAAYRDRCEDSCSADTVRKAVQVASGAACAAAIMPVSIDPKFVLPKGTIGFDFQPRGARPAPGFRPVVPGDSRISGGEKPLAGLSKEDLSSDSLTDVRRFRAEQIPDGEYRVIVVGAAGDTGTGNPFGSQVVINGRAIDIGANGLAAIATQMGSAVRNVSVGRVSGQAPMLVFDLVIANRTLDLQFLTGAVVSGLVVEPIRNKSVLDLAAAGNGITSVEQCMSATTEMQVAASDGVVATKTRISTFGSNGGGAGGGGAISGSPNNANPLSGN
jgi:hypothetical protein